MPGNQPPLKLKPSFEDEYPNSEVQLDDDGERSYRKGTNPLVDVMPRPFGRQVELVTMPELVPPSTAKEAPTKPRAAGAGRRSRRGFPKTDDNARGFHGEAVPEELR
jgi:hypothetical protein